VSPHFYYDGEPPQRIEKAISEIESRCKEWRPEEFEGHIREFISHQLPLLDAKNKQCPTWAANPPPTHIKYVLDVMWSEWKKARVRWGDIIHAMHKKFVPG